MQADPKDLEPDSFSPDSFSTALLSPETPAPGGVVGPDGLPAPKRFNVYRNNVISSLTEALAATYPAVQRLLGEEYFAALAREYIRHSPPVSPVLMWYGEGLAGFVEQFPPLAGYPYLGDVARAEWAWLQAYHAADCPTFDPARLGAVPQEKLGGIRFQAHSSFRVIRSRFPVLSLLQANRFDVDAGIHVNLNDPQDILIVRPDLEVFVLPLKAGGGVFAQALLEGQPLEVAAGLAASEVDTFSLAGCLQDLLASGAIAGMIE